MQVFISAVLVLAAVIAALKITKCVKRITVYVRIRSLKRLCDARITHIRNPLLSFLRPSKNPDIAVEIGSCIYLLRFIDGRGGRACVHFASEKYFVSFISREIFAGGLRLMFGLSGKAASSNATSWHRVQILPELKIPPKFAEESAKYGKSIIPVLLFSPAPSQLTYVTEERSSINLAFTGDELYGHKIFTGSTFCIYADRERRAEELEKHSFSG